MIKKSFNSQNKRYVIYLLVISSNTQSTYVSNIDTRQLAKSHKNPLQPYPSQEIEDLSISGSLPSFSEDSQAMILPDPPTHEPGGTPKKKVKGKSNFLKGLKIKAFSKK